MLKWGLPRRGVKFAKVPPTPYVYYPRVVRRDRCVPVRIRWNRVLAKSSQRLISQDASEGSTKLSSLVATKLKKCVMNMNTTGPLATGARAVGG